MPSSTCRLCAYHAYTENSSLLLPYYLLPLTAVTVSTVQYRTFRNVLIIICCIFPLTAVSSPFYSNKHLSLIHLVSTHFPFVVFLYYLRMSRFHGVYCIRRHCCHKLPLAPAACHAACSNYSVLVRGMRVWEVTLLEYDAILPTTYPAAFAVCKHC